MLTQLKMITCCLLVAPLLGAAPRQDAPALLTMVERSIVQDQGAWQVLYRLRYEGQAGLVVTPTEILAKVEGWVSNSRVPTHSVPRLSSVVVSGPNGGLSGLGDVIPAADEPGRCRERVIVQVWTEDPTAEGGVDVEGDFPVPPPPAPSTAGRLAPVDRQPILSIAPGASVRVRLRLDHLHFLHGDYDPLLGHRAVELSLGPATFQDVLPLNDERYLAQPRFSWPAPPEDRRDTQFFLSAPDSLHVEAHVPGNQYYRYPERPVRYATTMRLRFWYFIARGTEGECRARVAQYKDTPTAWKVLSAGGFEECLNVVGRWVKVERVFRTEAEATTLALDFRITGADVGEMWIDDVSLEPIAGAPPSTP
ncbi:MAG: hypothetical protein AB7I30_16665 [Isosphaeraceae bacterium]